MAFDCKILADSLNPAGVRLTTFEVTFPRIILAEFNTHRALSRNAASSRAVPVTKMLKRVLDDPFVPDEWGSNRPGMQAGDNLDPKASVDAERLWMNARHDAVLWATRLHELGVHKQIVNRLLEPFTWVTDIVTATEWDGFFAQRCSPKAQPEFRRIATMMREALIESQPVHLDEGQWHLPLVPDLDALRNISGFTDEDIVRIATMRCARVSYLTHDGVRDPHKDREDFDAKLLLQDPPHWSPFEHCCRARSDRMCADSNVRGWTQFRKLFQWESGRAA